ncbi:acyl-CoA thioesterase II [Bradyrhizobium canariense]|uniref:acyl-CoA thioesterase n=1 Tax=Bradyrhizobium TaxID=374 RepID=UPI000A18CC63|nr:acyl-CoA thioesterase II [Bradyrhizobium canariense]OSI30554.1 acyl-CoA thioesterase II [Bradyrhizobium canariense]OSI37315.1 acyl-CoA thioesterase II [Bradyrhizobium canariense]OSI52035.1 acyl-CoA thioesterase II [Bradyrhizobium canariense]OSI56338.1 acyl-CoA thioesterase II [Bradyrhizobium canariense]OSI59410.1 acyl-CoA thioesterase II [Bradyrhizobium canariense]
MSKGVAKLLAILDLEPIGRNLFRGSSPSPSWDRVFGGQLIAQAMVAASRTVEERMAHSLHACFVQPGDPMVPIFYEVEALRDSKSYSTRRVTAMQRNREICSVFVSFHTGEQSALGHQSKMPDAPPPEEVTAETLARHPGFQELPKAVRHWYEPNRPIELPHPPIELRPVEFGHFLGQKLCDDRIHFWIRIAEKLPDDAALHISALAYASDWTLLDAVLARYGRTVLNGNNILGASLDHAMWFHRPFHADDWLLYVKESPSAQDGRGLALGSLFRRDGALVATVAQEAAIRERR